MITAEQFIEKNHFNLVLDTRQTYCNLSDIQSAMIEFAKMHVEEALKEASEEVSLKESTVEEVNNNDIYPFINDEDGIVWIVNKDSILNAYPLDLIK